MNVIKIKYVAAFLMFVGLYSIAWCLQDQYLIKGDLSWQMHMARLVMAGGQYVKDFFEINPPLSIYLYMPAVILQNILVITAKVALRIYIFALVTLSLIVCNTLLLKIFTAKDNSLRYAFLFSLVVIDLIFPFSEFGQRECLFLYLVMPYLLLVCLRLQEVRINPYFAGCIGVVAGIGFAIKPFFLLTFVMVELFFLAKQKKGWSGLIWLFRTETFCIAGVSVLYLLAIYLLHPEYLSIVVPIAARFYYQAINSQWSEVFFHPILIYIASAALLCFLPIMNNRYRSLRQILAITLLGCVIVYGAQHLSWYYHLYPAFCLALLLYMFLSCEYVMGMQANWGQIVFTCLFGLLIFAYPLLFINQLHYQAVKQDQVMQPIITELRAQEYRKPVYFFSSKTAYMVSVLEESGAIHASRLQFLAWMNIYFLLNQDEDLPSSQLPGDRFFVRMLAEDLVKNKPELIYVDKLAYERRVGPAAGIDYIALLSRYPQFKTIWRHYRYVKTIQSNGNYAFDIYRYISDTSAPLSTTLRIGNRLGDLVAVKKPS